MTAYKYLYIIRHGKSVRDFKDVPDYDRPLKEKGINDSYKIAEKLMIKKNIPQLIMSSPANRALHTALIFARIFNYPVDKISIIKDLYMSSESENMELVKEIDNPIKSVMLFGHNPSFTDFANSFLNEKIDELPTSGVVCLKFETDTWKNIGNIKPVEYFFDYPKK
ncbi:MAG: hypothetical protein A2X13_10400 [Bacteroidetes bacterium GWC2_33_15]|nr:MAG: hypothetical protein A2X10_02955 [Bacteroidetes bacterium GWA2_33_15]OFX48812.1 MAG: hypothetical protein A2X13_10400 [Bacteroidetes bacterium GWC2_33_15]OFX66054.1 MAG: hypothetical protein A2X15_11550 [Bacteroidetes bacterium GWB2_32_14]OFX68184.1 MAG: hypothetical protein A2X14_07345 [Bacteroidetes bacterium GWD2_33_33]HAN17959.1 hypothetical protein [Bacteroidales bacterium]